MASKKSDKPREPNYAGAASIIRTSVEKSNEDKSKTLGDLSAAWAKVEGYGVNKKAAKEAFKMKQMSDEGCQEYLRSLYGMMGQFGLALAVDMVDAAEGAEPGDVPFPTKKAEAAESALLN